MSTCNCPDCRYIGAHEECPANDRYEELQRELEETRGTLELMRADYELAMDELNEVRRLLGIDPCGVCENPTSPAAVRRLLNDKEDLAELRDALDAFFDRMPYFGVSVVGRRTLGFYIRPAGTKPNAKDKAEDHAAIALTGWYRGICARAKRQP